MSESLAHFIENWIKNIQETIAYQFLDLLKHKKNQEEPIIH